MEVNTQDLLLKLAALGIFAASAYAIVMGFYGIL